MLSAADCRAILVRARARKFAMSVRACPGMAFQVPDEVIDWLKDDELVVFFDACRTFHITQRKAGYWEATM
jgi:hypothetical protein